MGALTVQCPEEEALSALSSLVLGRPLFHLGLNK
jgi:hypothetical protein